MLGEKSNRVICLIQLRVSFYPAMVEKVVYELGEAVATASRVCEKLSVTAVMVNVVDEEEIEKVKY